MKNFKTFIAIAFLSVIFSCEEDTVTSLVADDGIAPGPVTVTANAVENFSGGSKITYNLPDEDDLLYVVAEYQRGDDSELVSVKSSVFNNTLIVEGFANAQEYTVNLYAVDQSENRSTPTTVTISPEEPPYTYVCETVQAESTYGGIQLYWENPQTGLVTIEVYIEDEGGNLIFKDAIYTEGPTGERLVLGLDAVETNFVFIVRDRYNNRCGYIRETLTPLYIQLFDRANYQAVYQTHDTPDAYGWILPNTFDGVISGGNGFHSPPGWVDPDGELPEYADWSYDGIDLYPSIVTWDIGELVQLYRFKYWPRLGNYMWRHGNPHLFDLWGSDKLNADGSLDGWTLLLENAGPVKPSGQPGNDNTTEDEEAATAGFNFEISPDMPKVRYIRFVQKLAQNRTNTLFHISEVEFYGDNR
ncbi:DUF4959 domain-containing protein [Tamlana sp. 62-3]|uniref:DUF4959 domain-containing protein n=1 Tax=Neotamlana sargassicola TaxID=2883125 RepID=A0A9X1I630_9FLAO|nr:DUF5000 domain-containing lipoprotein [Tamlana sargassicola]MCB4807957.1 DUF4959 domain-containing protein [Tamlana sargassicola]